ncbi:heterodimeric methylmalonyl-CoA mutase small subunit [Actinoplanes derwentensis]|uniref:Heterodimeric methylmalonyl-CoA mutase small subunit n=1 Tax=Actinoplanes derwentensis TaxID=113562 RepID=A0A1H1YB90_9ACTN|nr:methylmalonyl-CoA mutase [Actinoplanes derwentensis]SDT18655.1 heterodimeric methylmalonyl-CoA mutase small subunit [Actinoplanes derwentensis]
MALAALRRSGTAGDDAGPEQVAELLAAQTYDGLRIPALQTAGSADLPPTGLPGRFPFVRGARAAGGLIGGWDVRQRHTDANHKEVREAALADLENGATSLWLRVGDGALPLEALPDALDGIHLDLAAVVLDSGDAFAAAGPAWFTLLEARGAGTTRAAGKARGGFGADPLGWRARTGDPSGLAGALRDAAVLAARCTAQAPGLRAITVDATIYHDAGGSEAEELGCAVAAGVGYLRALTGAGLTVVQALDQLEFRFAATADQFATIAKLRAARRVWARVAEICGVPGAGGQRQHAVTSAAMMTARDPWVNLLRTTVAAFAAGVGGADAVTVLPFDHRLGRPDGFARRLARNTQILLVEEAHVARVADPAGGSWYVERYTDELARAAWDWFTTVERAGGLAAALDSGLVADRLAATWQRRRENLAHRRDPITGVSEFPNLDEKPLQRRPAVVPAGGGLPRHHYAEEFERLRDRSAGHEPTVLLVPIGSPAASGQRVTFATNLFAAGGIAVTTARDENPPGDEKRPGEEKNPPGDVQRREKPPGVVCLCGSDRDYAERADAVAEEWRAAGATRVLIAGRGDIRVGGDAIAVLTSTLADLGVPQ